MERQIGTVKKTIHDLRVASMHFSAAFDRALKKLDQTIQHIEHEHRSAEDTDATEE